MRSFEQWLLLFVGCLVQTVVALADRDSPSYVGSFGGYAARSHHPRLPVFGHYSLPHNIDYIGYRGHGEGFGGAHNSFGAPSLSAHSKVRFPTSSFVTVAAHSGRDHHELLGYGASQVIPVARRVPGSKIPTSIIYGRRFVARGKNGTPMMADYEHSSVHTPMSQIQSFGDSTRQEQSRSISPEEPSQPLQGDQLPVPHTVVRRLKKVIKHRNVAPLQSSANPQFSPMMHSVTFPSQEMPVPSEAGFNVPQQRSVVTVRRPVKVQGARAKFTAVIPASPQSKLRLSNPMPPPVRIFKPKISTRVSSATMPAMKPMEFVPMISRPTPSKST